MNRPARADAHLPEEGQTIRGAITNITDYGLFIDLGGRTASATSPTFPGAGFPHPSKLYTVGEEIEVKILKYDKNSGPRLSGREATQTDPWERVPEQYAPGSRVTGKVVSITDYGVFVELEEGVEGLVHISEMSLVEKPRHPSKIVGVGEEIEVQVLKVEAETKRISLGMKQLQPNPWDVVEESYPVGSVIEGKIKNITDFGIFIGIEEGIDGLIPRF